MEKVFLIILCLFLISGFVLYILYQRTASKLSISEMKRNEYEHEIKTLKDINSQLREEMLIISENRRKADEKISELHSGDAVANAINGLSKPADSDSGKNDSSRD
jgi:hypothetical protein